MRRSMLSGNLARHSRNCRTRLAADGERDYQPVLSRYKITALGPLGAPAKQKATRALRRGAFCNAAGCPGSALKTAGTPVTAGPLHVPRKRRGVKTAPLPQIMNVFTACPQYG